MSKKKKNLLSENYLEKVPVCPNKIKWTRNEKGMVTLNIENRGLVNRIAQKLLNKPKVSYIHLDEMGSFVWPLINGKKTILEIGEEVETHFGEMAQPTYERLARFFQILDSYQLIQFVKS